MRTRKLLYPTEKVWVDKHKYDEAERLHYEREATLAASIAGCGQEMVAVNGFCHEEPVEEELKEDFQSVGIGKKQKKKKCSPKVKLLDQKLDFVLAGLLADHVWFEKPLFDQAETVYGKKLAEMSAQAASVPALPADQSALVPWAAAELFPSAAWLQTNLDVFRCTHDGLMACHHIVQDVWVNKFNFDDAEKMFVERSQVAILPHILELPSAPWSSNVGQKTPDEGYVTALPTPSTPAQTVAVVALSDDLPGSSTQTVNGKPQVSSLQALISEVWLEKPIYDDAERCFYANMFDGHPPGKVRLQEPGRPESSKRSRKDLKSRTVRKQLAGKRGNSAAFAPTLQGVMQSPPTWYFMHKDSESTWFNKPTYDSAEAQFYTCKASQLVDKEDSAGTSETMSAKPPQPADGASSAPEPHVKNMATNFLMHEKIWFDKFKYDDAEKKYYEQMNGPIASPSCQQSVSSAASAGPAGDQTELLARMAKLEAENQNLHSVVTDLQLTISKLESRLCFLEKASTSHHPSPPPTQHVTPMRKVELVASSSKKTEFSSAVPEKKVASSAAEEDDDIDLFGSDDEEEDQEAARVREERLKQYAEKKSKKPGLIAKSSILLDVKPWDDETDMAKMEECVRSIQMDGLVWGASKLVPVGYGIKKLQIQCVVEDDKVGTDILEEEITKFEDYVQSVDIAAFNKI